MIFPEDSYYIEGVFRWENHYKSCGFEGFSVLIVSLSPCLCLSEMVLLLFFWSNYRPKVKLLKNLTIYPDVIEIPGVFAHWHLVGKAFRATARSKAC